MRRKAGAGADRRDLVAELATLAPVERDRVLARLSEPQRDELRQRWLAWAFEQQKPPESDWLVWMIRAGRGFGKTRAGAEWVSEIARTNQRARIALVGATLGDARRVMIEGVSGLIAVAREHERVRWIAGKGELHFGSGAVAYVYGAESPELLRGPEHHAAWCDELGKWRGKRGEAAWDNLLMGLRLGETPRVLVTTTPRPTALMRRILAMPGMVETRGRTRDNPHLPASFVAAMLAEYEGTRLGRQELDGELVDEADGALWSRALLERARVRAAPELARVVVAVDPPASAGGDECGIVCAGMGADGIGYVIEDASVGGRSPEGWARAVADCAARHGADRVVAEVNQGGEMVQAVLRAVEASLPVRPVRASRGKVARAEPVAALYEAGRVKHVGAFPALEDQLCGLVPGGGYEGPGRSPDRADALVWALGELMLGRRGAAGVRAI